MRTHRLQTHPNSNDLNFGTKVADVIGLYLDPPTHAAVLPRHPQAHHAGLRVVHRAVQSGAEWRQRKRGLCRSIHAKKASYMASGQLQTRPLDPTG